jgi:hypothetical protein
MTGGRTCARSGGGVPEDLVVRRDGFEQGNPSRAHMALGR